MVPLGGVDVVLGIQWLQTLGTYSANHQEHFIEFHEFGKTHKLYRYQPPPTKLVTSHQMEKLRWKDTPMYISQCQEMEILRSEGDMEKKLETQELIRKTSQGVSRVTYGTPNNRKIEHIIEIELGTKPTSNNPYRYPHQRCCDSSRSHCRQISFEDKASLKGKEM